LGFVLFAATVFVVGANVLKDKKSNIHAVLVSAAVDDDCGGYAMDAEIAHTYHDLIDNGIPRNNIILFLNNRISNLSECYGAPWLGHLYTDFNHTKDYLPGLHIDYSGGDVSVDNVLAVLRGEKDKISGGSGRVLESKKDDHVFVFHSGHGQRGAFFINPNLLTTKQLNDAFKTMQEKHMFKQLLFYASTCNSGSMFDGKLKSDGAIFAVTDANPNQSSESLCKMLGDVTYICVCGEFGGAFLYDIDHKNLKEEPFSDQYAFIKKKVINSAVCEYGNRNFLKEFASKFEGVNNVFNSVSTYDTSNTMSLPRSPIVHYLIAKKRLAINPNNVELKKKVLEMEQERKEIKQIVIKIVTSFFKKSIDFIKIMKEPNGRITQDVCHHNMIKKIERKCPKILKSPFIGDFIDPMVNLCEQLVDESKLVEKIEIECI